MTINGDERSREEQRKAEADELVGLFPPGTRTDSDGTLVVGGCRLDDVAAQFGTPAYIESDDA